MAEQKGTKKLDKEKFLELYEALENDDFIGTVTSPDFVKSLKGTKFETKVKDFNKAYKALGAALEKAGLYDFEKYEKVQAEVEAQYKKEETT